MIVRFPTFEAGIKGHFFSGFEDNLIGEFLIPQGLQLTTQARAQCSALCIRNNDPCVSNFFLFFFCFAGVWITESRYTRNVPVKLPLTIEFRSAHQERRGQAEILQFTDQNGNHSGSFALLSQDPRTQTAPLRSSVQSSFCTARSELWCDPKRDARL